MSPSTRFARAEELGQRVRLTKPSLPRWPRRKLTSLPALTASCCCAPCRRVPSVIAGYWLRPRHVGGAEEAPARSRRGRRPARPRRAAPAHICVFQVKSTSVLPPRNRKILRSSQAALGSRVEQRLRPTRSPASRAAPVVQVDQSLRLDVAVPRPRDVARRVGEVVARHRLQGRRRVGRARCRARRDLGQRVAEALRSPTSGRSALKYVPRPLTAACQKSSIDFGLL